MVCRRMGLLDDAIREHLELKRLRGADPGAGRARGRTRPSDPFAAVSRLTRMARRWTTITMSRLTTAVLARRAFEPAEDDPGRHSRTARPKRSRTSGRTTAELDMRTVLGDEPPATTARSSEPAASGRWATHLAGAPPPSTRDDRIRLHACRQIRPVTATVGSTAVARRRANDDLRAARRQISTDDWTAGSIGRSPARTSRGSETTEPRPAGPPGRRPWHGAAVARAAPAA